MTPSLKPEIAFSGNHFGIKVHFWGHTVDGRNPKQPTWDV